MKRFNFGTFVVDDANRQAFEICQDVANLRPTTGQPVVLLAEEGSGKTHLLYAIVNRIRSSSSSAGIAFVSARDFPQPVRSLIHDPAPVERAKAAVLLVDHLERFDSRQEELEAVVRIFLDNRHHVILATSTHPARLTNLTPGLREILQGGQILEFAPARTDERIDMLERRIREENEQIMAEQRAEIELLKSKLQSSGNGTSHDRESEAERLLKSELQDLRDQLSRSERELITTRQELRERAAERAAREAMEHEVAALRERLDEMQLHYEKAMAELDAKHRESEEVERLRRELEETRGEATRSRSEANGLLSRAEALLDEVQKSRTRFAEAQQEQSEQIQEIRALESVLAGEEFGAEFSGFDAGEERVPFRQAAGAAESPEGPAESGRERDELRQQLDSAEKALGDARAESEAVWAQLNELLEAHGALQTHVSELETERERQRDAAAEAAEERDKLADEVKGLRKECRQLQECLVQSRSDRETVKYQLRQTSEQLAKAEEEINSLRREAAQQVAAANTEAGERERQLSNALDEERSTRRMAAEELAAVRGQLHTVVDSVGRLADEMRAGRGLSAEPSAWNPPSLSENVSSADTDMDETAPKAADTPNEYSGSSAELAESNEHSPESPSESPVSSSSALDETLLGEQREHSAEAAAKSSGKKAEDDTSDSGDKLEEERDDFTESFRAPGLYERGMLHVEQLRNSLDLLANDELERDERGEDSGAYHRVPDSADDEDHSI